MNITACNDMFFVDLLPGDQRLLIVLLGCLENAFVSAQTFKTICQQAIFHQLCFYHFLLILVLNSIPSALMRS